MRARPPARISWSISASGHSTDAPTAAAIATNESVSALTGTDCAAKTLAAVAALMGRSPTRATGIVFGSKAV